MKPYEKRRIRGLDSRIRGLNRDPKGLYAKSRRGEIKNYTGLDIIYVQPETPEVHFA
ncbi:adenylyl-sulfate kinase [Heliomicrobium gestii]|uniref:adenylyl-sulfate kinase n=1 Tax=Heliomicrobium gestii TaxID=2699 RepID=UPI0038B2DAC3